MKASITNGDTQAVLTLTPENDSDIESIRAFAIRLTRTHIINHRGFAYLAPETEFLVQSYPSRD